MRVYKLHSGLYSVIYSVLPQDGLETVFLCLGLAPRPRLRHQPFRLTVETAVLLITVLKNSSIFHDSTRPQLHFDGLPAKSRRCVVSIYSVRYKYYKKIVVLVWPGAVQAPIPV